MNKVIVLGGGTSDEREVSLRSSQEVVNAVKNLGVKVELIDPKFSDEYLSAGPKDIVLPILHGTFGEDGTLQAQLEEKQIPFLGSGSKSSKDSFDKWQTRTILEAHNIPVPEGAIVGFDEYKSHSLAKQPHVIKLVDGGSSIGTYIIRNPKEHTEAEIREIFGDHKMLVEQLIEGTEITVPILDQTALPVIEIRPPEDSEFDYENKYNGKTAEICPPQSISDEQQEKAQALAENVHKVMSCRHLSRVDIMIDSSGNMYVLEINTIPGMTSQSLYPKSAKVAGLEMDQLVQKLIELVARDYSLNL